MGCKSVFVFTLGAIVLLAFVQIEALNFQGAVEPVNFNWIISLPWDVANSLRAPIGGPVAIILSSFLALVLLFGLLLSPLNYLFGFPPRIYHTYRNPGLLGRSLTSSSFPESTNHTADMADVLVQLFDEVTSRIVFDNPQTYDSPDGILTGRELTLRDEDFKRFGFIESIFHLVPEANEMCRQLMTCHAHGFLPLLPTTAVRFYRWISKNIITIPDDYKAAIKLGIHDQDACAKVYDCPKNLFQLSRGSIGRIRQKIVNLFPEGTTDLWYQFYSRYTGNEL